MGVPKKTHHPATQPHTPNLATRERGEPRGHSGEEDENEPFKARPLPKGLFDKVSVSTHLSQQCVYVEYMYIVYVYMNVIYMLCWCLGFA